MLVSSVLLEARKHPHLNQKISVNSVIRREHEKAEDLPIGIKNCFVNFLGIEKLGVNPQHDYKTPLGIYCYPSSLVLEHTTGDDNKELSMNSLPYSGDKAFANIFNVSGNILRIDTMTWGQSDELCDKLIDVLNSRFPNTVDWSRQIELYRTLASYHAEVKTIGGKFWFVLWSCSNFINEHFNVPAPSCWTSLFRRMGIDGVVDMGGGIIYSLEPCQAVFFSVSTIKNNIRVDNKYSSDSIARSSAASKDITQFIADIDNKSVEEILAKPFLIKYVTDQSKVDRCIQRNPEIIQYCGKLTKHNLLLSLTSSNLKSLKFLITPTPLEPLDTYITILNYDYMYGERQGEASYSMFKKIYDDAVRQNKRHGTFITQVRELLTEQDVIALVSSTKFIAGLVPIIVNVFPQYTKLHELLRQMFPKAKITVKVNKKKEHK